MRITTRRTVIETSGTEDAALESKVNRLGDLPLALDQISDFWSRQDTTFQEFLQLYETGPEEYVKIFEYGVFSREYEHSLATAWDASFAQLTQGAMALLDVLCFLNPDHISETILESHHGALYLRDYPRSRQSYFAARSGTV